jgi:uncharacterized lipoprotein YmbA
MMRLVFWFALLLGGCSSAVVRCDSHLVPVNAPSVAPALPTERPLAGPAS